MASITLDSIRDSISRKYASFEVDFGDGVIELRNPLRIPKDDRAKMATLFKDGVDTDDENAALDATVAKFAGLLEIAATPESRPALKKFLELISGEDDNLLILSEVLDSYMSEQQVGEA